MFLIYKIPVTTAGMAAIVSKVVARGAALACAVGIIGRILQMAAVESLAFLDVVMSASTQTGH